MNIRLTILKSRGSYFIAKHEFSGDRYKVVKNGMVEDRKVGDDINIYAKRSKAFMRDILTPISLEEELSLEEAS